MINGKPVSLRAIGIDYSAVPIKAVFLHNNGKLTAECQEHKSIDTVAATIATRRDIHQGISKRKKKVIQANHTPIATFIPNSFFMYAGVVEPIRPADPFDCLPLEYAIGSNIQGINYRDWRAIAEAREDLGKGSLTYLVLCSGEHAILDATNILFMLGSVYGNNSNLMITTPHLLFERPNLRLPDGIDTEFKNAAACALLAMYQENLDLFLINSSYVRDRSDRIIVTTDTVKDNEGPNSQVGNYRNVT